MLIRSCSPLTCHITGSFKSALQVKVLVFFCCCLLFVENSHFSGAPCVDLCAVHVILPFLAFFSIFVHESSHCTLSDNFIRVVERPGSDLLRHEHFPPQQTGIGRCYGFFYSL